MATNNVMNKLIFTLKALTNDITIRASHGTLILVLDDENVSGVHTYKKLKKVTENYSTKNKQYISLAFATYGVKKVLVASGHTTGGDGATTGISNSIDDILRQLNTVYENGYLVVPQLGDITDDNVLANTKTKIVNFVKTQRSEEDYPYKAVLYNNSSNDMGIINFTGKDLGITDFATTPDEYALDVACVLCTLGANESITGQTAKRVTSCDVKIDPDECVGNGELFLYNDGTDIVFSPGVNSLTSIPTDQNDYITKIRVVEVIDMVKSDLRNAFKKNYIGRYGNSYSNRKTLVRAVNSYLRGLAKEGYLSNDKDSFCELDVEATRNYLESVRMINTDDMTDDEVLRHPIDTHVFIKLTLYVMDVVESINTVLMYDE